MEFYCGDKIVKIPICHMVNAGYSGRNQEIVKKHIEELAKIGVKVPAVTPTFYPIPCLQLTQEAEIQVACDQTSAEAEYVFLQMGEKTYLTVGSDHSDRDLERLDVGAAKRVCPNVIAKSVWDYREVKDHLDQLVISCEVLTDTGWRLYQQGNLQELLSPEELLRLGKNVISGESQGLALFSGTIPTIGELVYGTNWKISLNDTIINRKITMEYHVNQLPKDIE